MFKPLMLIVSVAACVAQAGLAMRHHGWPLGAALLVLSGIPMATLLVIRHSLRVALVDLLNGAMDIGLVVVPAVWGAVTYGVAGAVAGGVTGHLLVDSKNRFFAGGIGAALRSRDIHVLKESAAGALGKLAGGMLVGGALLSLLLLAGVHLRGY